MSWGPHVLHHYIAVKTIFKEGTANGFLQLTNVHHVINVLIAHWSSAGENEDTTPWMLSSRSSSLQGFLPCTCATSKNSMGSDLVKREDCVSCCVAKNILETTELSAVWAVTLSCWKRHMIFHQTCSENGVRTCVNIVVQIYGHKLLGPNTNGPSGTHCTPHTNLHVI